MNIFILNTGRCGSTTFIKACQHINNFTSTHESRNSRLGNARFDYPDNHIEADNRLSWFLGKLDKVYGNNAVYVHLKRNKHAVAKSYSSRISERGAILPVYRAGILWLPDAVPNLAAALDYCETVNFNIELFLKDKTHKMIFNLENAKNDFQIFWNLIGAKGDFTAAISEFDIYYNASEKGLAGNN